MSVLLKQALDAPTHSQPPVEAETVAAEAQVHWLEGHPASTEGHVVRRNQEKALRCRNPSGRHFYYKPWKCVARVVQSRK